MKFLKAFITLNFKSALASSSSYVTFSLYNLADDCDFIVFKVLKVD